MTEPAKDGTSKEGKRPRGAPAGNRNNLRHGLRSGRLPADCKYLELRLGEVRRNLEAAVLAARGEIDIQAAGCIQTAIRWERHGCLCQRWLTKECAELKPEQRLAFSREIARASAERDKAIAALKLQVDVRDSWAAIDALPALPAPASQQANQADGSGGCDK